MAISWRLRTCTSTMRTATQSKKDCCSGPESTQRPFLHGAPLGSGATLWLIFVTPAVPKRTIPPRTSQKEDPVRIYARLPVCAEQHAELQARQWRARSGPLSQGRQSELSVSLPADSCTKASRMISGFCGGILICTHTSTPASPCRERPGRDAICHVQSSAPKRKQAPDPAWLAEGLYCRKTW